MKYAIAALLLIAVLYGCSQPQPEERPQSVQADIPVIDAEAVFSQIGAGEDMEELDSFYYTETGLEELDIDGLDFEFDESEFQ